MFGYILHTLTSWVLSTLRCCSLSLMAAVAPVPPKLGSSGFKTLIAVARITSVPCKPRALNVEILLRSKNVSPSNSVALATLGRLWFCVRSLIWIVFPDPFFTVKDCVIPLERNRLLYHSLYRPSIHFHQSVTWLSLCPSFPGHYKVLTNKT